MIPPTSGPAGVTRRMFLRSTAAIGAGLVLAPTILGAEEKPADRPLNIGFIGVGTQGQVLLQNCLKIPGLQFRAICDIWPFNQGRTVRTLQKYKQDVRGYADYREMLSAEKSLDAVIIASPDWMHAEHAIACLQAGVHVYCEKEMSNSLEKARQMVVAARETKRLLQIGHQRRSNPRYLHSYAKILQEARLLGRITHVYGQWNRSTASTNPRGWALGADLDDASLKQYGYDSMQRLCNWRWFKKYGGGPLADLGSHQIDVFNWFLGTPPRAVMATGGRDYYKDFELPDNVLALYDFETAAGPVRGFYQVVSTSSARNYFETFMGTDGTLQISESAGACRLFAEGHLTPLADRHPWQPWADKGYILQEKKPDDETKKEPEKDKTPDEAIMEVYKSKPPTTFLLRLDLEKSLHMPHLENFFAAIRTGVPLNCPAEVGYETAVSVLRVNEALEAGRRIEFKPEEFRVA